MVDTHAAHEKLLQLGTDASFPVPLIEPFRQRLLLSTCEESSPFELFGNGPALLSIEAEDQRRRPLRFFGAVLHLFEMFAEQFPSDPVELQWNRSLAALNQLDFPIVFSP